MHPCILIVIFFVSFSLIEIQTATVQDGDHSHSKHQIFMNERDALMDLYTSTIGMNWINRKNWGSKKGLDEWHGVQLNHHNKVVGLVLLNNNLRGNTSLHGIDCAACDNTMTDSAIVTTLC